MSNYIHPMQDAYNKKVSKILESISNPNMQYDIFIKILRENQIKFFSKDDLSKLTKLYVPSDKLNIKQAFIHLQLIYIHVNLDTKYFVVKFRGRSISSLAFKIFDVKKERKMHGIQQCLEHFKAKMARINGKEGFWFKALGGISGTHCIKKDVFQRKIIKLFANTCHSSCIDRFLEHVMEDTASTNLTWQHLRKKININGSSQASDAPLQVLSPQKRKHQIASGLRIKTFEIDAPKFPVLDISQSQHLRSSTQGQKCEQRPRRRLKTIQDKQKLQVQQNHENLQLSMGPLVQEIIHSKSKIRYKLGVFKRSKSTIGGY